MGQSGGIGALPGFGGTPFGGATGTQAGLTGAVKGGGGQLTEYNPTTMSQTTQAPPPSTAPEFTAAGMDAGTGMPSYVSNWLQSGGTGTMPTSTGIMPASPVTQSTAGDLFKPTTGAKVAAKGAEAIKPGQIKPKVTAPAGGIGAPAGAAAPALKQVGGNMQQPLYVSDQWNGSIGSSQQMATPALGGPNANQGGQAPFWTDGKGNYFFDAQGTKPVTGAVTQQLKNQFG